MFDYYEIVRGAACSGLTFIGPKILEFSFEKNKDYEYDGGKYFIKTQYGVRSSLDFDGRVGGVFFKIKFGDESEVFSVKLEAFIRFRWDEEFESMFKKGVGFDISRFEKQFKTFLEDRAIVLILPDIRPVVSHFISSIGFVPLQIPFWDLIKSRGENLMSSSVDDKKIEVQEVSGVSIPKRFKEYARKIDEVSKSC